MLSRVWNNVGSFSSKPAEMIDNTYLDKPNSYLGYAGQFLKLRTYYGMFIGASVLDLIFSGALSFRYAVGAAVRIDDVQDRRLEQQKKYNTLFSKNILALISSAIGFINPKLVTIHFLPEKKIPGVRSGGNYYHKPEAQLFKPTDAEEVIAIVENAKQSGKKIIPMGAGLSQGKQFLPSTKDGWVIDLENFKTVQVNAKEKKAIVGAGISWNELQIILNEFNFALGPQQASSRFKFGGSLGTNIHGWNHLKGMLSNVLLSMDVVTANGLITLTPKDELFHAITGGLGLLGIVLSAELQLVDNELLNERALVVSNYDYVNYFYNAVLPDKNIRMHLFRLSLDKNNLLGDGVAVNYWKVANTKPPKSPGLTTERIHGRREERVLVNLARNTAKLREAYWRGEKDRLLKNDSPALTTNEIMQAPVNAMFTPSVNEAEWLQEYFLPGEKLNQFLKDLGKLLMRNEVALLNASVRFVKQNNKSPLSYAYDGDQFAVVLCFNQSLHDVDITKAYKWLREAQLLAIEAGGTYYLPYQPVTAPEVFRRAYPHVDKFLEIKKMVDPDGLFESGFYKKYLKIRPAPSNHIQAIMQSEASKKEFAGFLNNVLQRVEPDKLYALLTDILKYKDSHREIYKELTKRLPEIIPSTLNSIRRTLHSLSQIKKDLTEQATLLLSDVKKINGMVEIGYPGRFLKGLMEEFEVTGKIVVVLEQVSMTDYLQTGFPAPYHEFQKLDYNKPSLADLADNSADLITLYIGLHHFPESDLETFLTDVRRVLRPGGKFLLVDHDVIDEASLNYAKGAHTFFNLVTGVSVEDEMKEIRNFQPMSYWVKLLEKYDLGYSVQGADVPLIREGDPSRNRMVCFKKPGLEKSLAHENIVNDEVLTPNAVSVNWKKVSNEPASIQAVSMFNEEVEQVNNNLDIDRRLEI